MHALLLCLAFLPAAEGHRYSAFNGRDLAGWHERGCKAAVEDGLLVIKEGDGLLWFDHRLTDFELELDWKPRRAEQYDSGIYFRCELPPEGKPFPKRYQVNLKQNDEANLIGFKDGRSEGLVKPGAWNHLRLRVVGERATLELNGKTAWDVTGIEPRDGLLGIQVEVPGGGEYEFKNIHITELGATSLFNGVDLTGWQGAGDDAAKCWLVEDGLLVCNGKKGPWLRSEKTYGDYNLRLEYKLKPGGNSGVYIRVPENGNHHGEDAGIEIQILDDKAERYKDIKDYQYTGSLYAIVPASEHVGRPAGEWNSLEIDCRGTKYRVVHNGVTIIDADETKSAELAKRRTSGFLGLQNHSEHVWFRNVRVAE